LVPATSHETQAALPEQGKKFGPAVICISTSSSLGETNLPSTPDGPGGHAILAAAAPHGLGRRLTTPSRTSQFSVFVSPRQDDGSRSGSLPVVPTTSVPPADVTTAPQAAATPPVPVPARAVTPVPEQSQNRADESSGQGLVPQFLLAPYFPKRPQPTIMLAIADESARNDLNMALTQAGFVVFTAATARDALGVLRTPATPMDAAVVDVSLPDVSGLHLVGRLKELFPWLPVLIYADSADGVAQMPLRDTGVPVLLKSSATSDMLAQVRALVS
jgi:CheY-like chemotaxis protein